MSKAMKFINDNGQINFKKFKLQKVVKDVERFDHLAKALDMQFESVDKPSELFQALLIIAEITEKKIAEHIKKGSEPASIKLKARAGVIQHSWHPRLGIDIKLNRTIAVRGPAGNGKSTGVAAVAKSLGFNVYQMDCSDNTTVEQLIGGLVPEADGKGGISIVFREGLLARAFKDPKGLVQLDEFDALDPRVTLSLQQALHKGSGGDGKRFVSVPDLPEGGIKSAGSCPIVVTMNTWGTGATREYVGRNSIDAASLDRFNSVIDTDYEKEEDILKSLGLDNVIAAYVVTTANIIREMIRTKGLRVVLSTRRLMDIAECVLVLNLSIQQAFERDFFSRLDDSVAINFDKVKIYKDLPTVSHSPIRIEPKDLDGVDPSISVEVFE